MSGEVCAVCCVPAGQRCAGCQQVTYCGRDHQRQHWKDTHRNECRCYKVARNEALGRHLVATRPIKQGELIFRDPPLILGPKIVSVPVCLGCNRNLGAQNVHECQHCGWPLCDQNCESAPFHVEECQLLSLRSYRPRISVNEGDPKRKDSAYCVIVPLRMILLKEKHPQKYAKLRSMESHIETRIKTPLYSVVKSNLVPFIRKILGLKEHSAEEILQMAAVMDTNSYEVRVPKKGIKIRALTELGAMLSHNCRPNTKHYFDDAYNLVLVATVDIPKDAVICVSYTQPLLCTMQRRYAIRQAKCFDCCCDRCQDPTEFQSYTGSVICPNCAKGKIVAVNPLNFHSDWQCDSPKCAYHESAQQNIERSEALQASILRLTKDSPAEYEWFLETYQSSLHPWNTSMLQVKYALTQLYGGKLQGYTLPELNETQLRRQSELCVELLEVADRLEPGLSSFRAKLLIELRNTLLVLREKLGSRFHSIPIGWSPESGIAGRSQQKGRKSAKSKLEFSPSNQTMAQRLESAQQEIEEMIKTDPTLQM